MEKIGKIISTHNNVAKVEIRRASACGEKCGSCSGGCKGTGLYIEADNKIGGKPGQFVKIELETHTVLKAAFLAYLLPLFMLILGVFVGSKVHDFTNINFSLESFSILFGVIFMILSFILIKKIDIIYKKQKKITYRITKVL